MWLFRFLSSVVGTIIVVLGLWAAYVLSGPNGRDVVKASRGKYRHLSDPTK